MRYREPQQQMRQSDHGGVLCLARTRGPARLAAALCIALTCVLSACGSRDAAYDRSPFAVHAQIAPRDVAVPGVPNKSTPYTFNGVYGDGPGSYSCCWIAPDAMLLVHKYGPARTLVAGFRVIRIPKFEDGQTVTIQLGSGPQRAKGSWDVYPGEQYTATLAIPANVRATTGLVPVHVSCSIDYVPARDAPPEYSLLSYLRLRPPVKSYDVRNLGVILLYLYFR